MNIEKTLKDLINYLKKNHPYPEDVFKNTGREARVGYNSCIRKITEFLEEKMWLKRDSIKNLDSKN